MEAHAVESDLVDVAVVRYVGDNATIPNAVRRPAKSLYVRVGKLVAKCCLRSFGVRVLNAIVPVLILTIFVLIVFVLLTHVVGGIANDNKDRSFLLLFTRSVFALEKANDCWPNSESSKVSTRQMPSKGL